MTSYGGVDNKVAVYVGEFKDARPDKGNGVIGQVVIVPGINADVKEPSDIVGCYQKSACRYEQQIDSEMSW